jgi:hypothetical protein
MIATAFASVIMMGVFYAAEGVEFGSGVDAAAAGAVLNVPAGRVLHGWGQHLFLYDTEARAYAQAIGREPTILSDYMDLLLVEGLTPALLEAYEEALHDRRRARGARDGDVQLRDDEVADDTLTGRRLGRVLEMHNTTPADFAVFRKKAAAPYTPLLGVMWHLTNDRRIAAGEHDEQIIALARQVKACDFVVMLRPGFEFGPFGYMEKAGMVSREHYASMFRRFVDIFRNQQVDNAVFVWNTVGVESYDHWMDYYPGDAYVDWFGLNLFSRQQIEGCGRFLDEAAARDKPVIICESAPAFEGGSTDPRVWERFFGPYFELMHQRDEIRAMVYINLDWSHLPAGPFRHWPDSRVQSSADLLQRYATMLRSPRFVHGLGQVLPMRPPGDPAP